MPLLQQADLAPERHDRIREMLRSQSAVRLNALREALQVSPATVRRDLEELERRGELRRVHGGAVSMHSALEEPVFDEKVQLGAAEKQRIAQAALEHIQGGDTIYLDGGSTLLALARLLKHRNEVTLVTNSIRAAQELASSGPRLILVGGKLRRLSQTMVGPLTRATLDHLHVDKAFMGTLGLTLDALTTTDPEEAFTKELAMRRADKVYLLVDSSKVGKTALSRAGSLDNVDVVITDTKMDPLFAQGLRKKDIDVVQV